jgi:DNA-binding IclR family transcriptional regulator
MSKDDADDRYRAPALDKGLDILELLANSAESLTQAEIAKELGRSPNETYRMLNTLVRRGYVLKDLYGEGYQLSLHMFTLAHRHPPIGRLIGRALPLMRQLARQAQQSCHICIEKGGRLVIVASVEAPGNWGLSLRVGSIIGLYNTGSGRILAAFRSRDDLDHLIAHYELADGERSMPRKEFEKILTSVRERGYEKMPSATAIGVTNLGYPIFGPDGDAVAALICPYLKRIDAHVSPSLDEVAVMLADVTAKLSMTSPKRDAAE